MIWKSHLLSMIVYAIFVCIVLALLRREDKKSQIKYALFLFLIMVAGGLLFGWFMYLFTLLSLRSSFESSNRYVIIFTLS